MTLAEAPEAFCGTIVDFSGSPEWVERLSEMGLHIGMEIEVTGRAPLGGPLIVKAGPLIVALRDEETKCLIVQAKS